MPRALAEHLFEQFRPVFANLYTLAWSTNDLSVKLSEREKVSGKTLDGLPTARGPLPFAKVQEMCAEAYGNALLLMVDNVFGFLKEMGKKKGYLFGPTIKGHKAGSIIRAATNAIRHAHEWRYDATADENLNVKILRGLGLDFRSERVSIAILTVLSEGDYFRFEDACTKILEEILS